MSNETQQKLSLIRRYIYEVVLVTLCLVVATLFQAYRDLNNSFMSHLQNDSEKMQGALNNNTNALNNFILTFKK